LLLALVLEGEGIAAHVLQDLGATEQAVRTEIDRLLAAGTEGELGAELGLPVYFVGERVLMHDADPPFRLWEGRVAQAGEASYDISIPGRPDGELVKANSTRIHPIPMRWTEDCPFCKFG
jgi:hypothetical protein